MRGESPYSADVRHLPVPTLLVDQPPRRAARMNGKNEMRFDVVPPSVTARNDREPFHDVATRSAERTPAPSLDFPKACISARTRRCAVDVILNRRRADE